MGTARENDTANEPCTPEKPVELHESPSKSWDHVDEASWESFPASDPPGRSAGKDNAAPTLNGEPLTDEPESKR